VSIRIVIEIQNPEELFDAQSPKIGRVLADLGLLNRRKLIRWGFKRYLRSGLEENGVKVRIEAEDLQQPQRRRLLPFRFSTASSDPDYDDSE
jgi:hypothetical protein